MYLLWTWLSLVFLYIGRGMHYTSPSSQEHPYLYIVLSFSTPPWSQVPCKLRFLTLQLNAHLLVCWSLFFSNALFLAQKQLLAPDEGWVSVRRVRLEEGTIKRDQQQHFACFNRTLCFGRLLPGLGTTTSVAKQ